VLANKMLLKVKERARNKEAYELLKLNKVKYRKRLNDAYNNQVERMKQIKEDENKYNDMLNEYEKIKYLFTLEGMSEYIINSI
jgi:hypothetical protein